MVDKSQATVKALITSMVGPLMNKVKVSMQGARKNRQLATKLESTMDLLSEQLLPHYLTESSRSYDEVNMLHNLCYLLAMKTQQVFNSRVIHTCIDQNWDLKGFKQVLVRILRQVGVGSYDDVTQILDFTIKTQNLQSSSCIKAIGAFIRNQKKPINADDLGNPVNTYETEFEFLKEDIQQYRQQRIKYECFTVLHPWAYDLDKVDFKYIMNNDLTDKICAQLQTQSAQVFWLSFFKSQLAVSADDFFGALRELCNLNKIPQFYDQNLPAYQDAAIACDFVFSLADHAAQITQIVQQVADAGSRVGYNALKDQVKIYQGEFSTANVKIGDFPSGFSVNTNPRLTQFDRDSDLSAIQLRQLSPQELEIPVDLCRRTFDSVPNQAAAHKLHMRFEAVDTEELKNLEISVEGTQGVYKIGEGEANHYQIPNDKKLWESQLMIVCKDGKYFIRDLGVVHTSRIKVDMNTQIQIQQDALIDLGKVVHYHFDKVTHKATPTQAPSNTFYIMRPNASDYIIEETHDDEQDPPTLRARPTWVSSDENKDLIQKEIILEAVDRNHYFSIGRSMKREVQIKLKAVSADHCNITYDEQKGWFISESGKEKPSSNGTFVFMKSQKQMHDHEPSSLIPLHDGMVLSFINYEIRVNLEKKEQTDVDRENQNIRERVEQMRSQQPAMSATMGATMAAAVPAELDEAVQPAVEEEEAKVEVKPEQSIHDEEEVPAADAVEAAVEAAEEAAEVAERERDEADAAEAAADKAEAVAEQEAAEAAEAEVAAAKAAAVAEKERAEADAAQAVADKEDAEADRAEAVAAEERKEADAAQAVADKEDAEADRAEAVAAEERKEADAAQVVADKEDAEADRAEATAEQERAEADAAAAAAKAAEEKAEKERAEAEAIAKDASASAAAKAQAEKEAQEAEAAAKAAEAEAAKQDAEADQAEAVAAEERKEADAAQAVADAEDAEADRAEAVAAEERKEADAAQAVADKEDAEADRAEAVAAEERKEADAAQAVADKEDAEADKAEAVAEQAAEVAQEERKEADAAEAAAEQAAEVAAEEKKEAEAAEVAAVEAQEHAEEVKEAAAAEEVAPAAESAPAAEAAPAGDAPAAESAPAAEAAPATEAPAAGDAPAAESTPAAADAPAPAE